MDKLKRRKPNNTALLALFQSAKRLNEIVEGVSSVRWSCGGMRLKDSTEWCDFYVKLSRAKETTKD